MADTTTSEGGVAPERPLESPNRITRLIANRREKLMRMATMDCRMPLNNSSNAAERSASDSTSENAGDNTHTKRRSKSKSKSKNVKRKHTRVSERRRISARRKCTKSVLKVNSDSDSDDERPVDATQPSTSSGLISRRSRYAGVIEEDDGRSNYSSSSSSSSSSNNSSSSSNSSNYTGDNQNISGKRKRSKTDSDTSTKAHRRKHHKYRSRHENVEKVRNNRLDDNSDEEKITDSKDCVKNGSTSKDCREDGPSTRTPNNRSPQVPCIPDSDVKSVVSSQGGKNSGQTCGDTRNNAGADDTSSDHEHKSKSLECFRKKLVELARRSYRRRSVPQPQMTVSTTSDSSD